VLKFLLPSRSIRSKAAAGKVAPSPRAAGRRGPTSRSANLYLMDGPFARCRPPQRVNIDAQKLRCWCRSSVGNPVELSFSPYPDLGQSRQATGEQVERNRGHASPEADLQRHQLQLKAGAATPAPPVGPRWVQHGVNIMEFLQAYNSATESAAGNVVP